MAAKSREIVRYGHPRIFSAAGQPGDAGTPLVYGVAATKDGLGPKLDPVPNTLLVQNPTDVTATFVIDYAPDGSTWANSASTTMAAGGAVTVAVARPGEAARLRVTAGLYCIVDTLQHGVGNGLA